MQSSVQNHRWPSLLRAVTIGRRPKWTLVRIAILVALVFLTRQFALLPIRAIGPSMLPTYQDHGINFVNRLAYISHPPQRGDVVAIRTSGTSVMYMKRIIGLPGETLEFHHGRVFINGQQLDEPYLKYPCDWESTPITVASNKFFVVGDNRSMPPGYHYFGETEKQRIVGKILLCKNLFAPSAPQR